FPLGADGEPDVNNLGAGGEIVRPYHLASTDQHPDVPSQSWHASHHQWGRGKCDGFVTSSQSVLEQAAETSGDDEAARKAEAAATAADAAAAGMGYWTEEDLPFYYGLARTFPLADHWFASCLGPTFPNRRFLVAGTAHGL